jgi:hypothetical protein
MRRVLLPLAAAAVLVPTLVAAEQPSTTRIETRPFYGATVTLEEGVRVFRPLPPHERIIINPGGATPLNLGYQQHRTVSTNHSYNYHRYDGPAAAPSYGGWGYPVGGGRHYHGHGHGPKGGGRGGKH